MHGLATRIIIASSFASLLLTASVAYAATYDVTNYGATGNSVTDDRVAIQNTINAAASTFKKMRFRASLIFSENLDIL